jgi:lactoylglutathione lyase
MNIEHTIPFFWVTDMQNSLHHYVDLLGFKIIHQWIDNGKLRWCRLRREGANLMLQEFWKEGPHGNLPGGELGVGVSIYFLCADAIALYLEFKSKMIEVSKPFVGNGMWVTGLKDPDGYQLCFESKTDQPEEAVYNEKV